MKVNNSFLKNISFNDEGPSVQKILCIGNATVYTIKHENYL